MYDQPYALVERGGRFLPGQLVRTGELEAAVGLDQKDDVDRFERVFVPAVLGLATLLLFAWVVVDEPFRDSFYRAMAVLVAASPCALAIATPSAVLSGVARAARGGVLIKGGAPLELLGSLDAIAFDKTGTLTSGEPRIREIIPASGVSKEELMAIAVAVESLSDHPLAQAIARDGKSYIGDLVQRVRRVVGGDAVYGVVQMCPEGGHVVGRAQ